MITSHRLYCRWREKVKGTISTASAYPWWPSRLFSAYTPKGYVDNLRHDFGSIPRFIEHNFGILEGALNFADQRATTDLIEFLS